MNSWGAPQGRPPEFPVPMPTLVIRNVPEELMVSLREAAEREQRSLTGQVIALLSQATGHARMGPEDHLRRARDLHQQVDRRMSTAKPPSLCALAQRKGLRLATRDRALLRLFPDTAFCPQ